MLGKLRDKSQSYLIYFFFGIIIVVFVFFFGPQSDACSPSAVAVVATVDGREVTSRQLDQMHWRYSRDDRARLGREMDPLQRKLWLTEDVILVHLLAQEARDVGMDVSDEQLVDYIIDRSRNPDFPFYATRDGSEFDPVDYERSVSGNFGMSIAAYEEFKKNELLTIQFMNLLMASILVSDEEVEAFHRWRNTQYQLEFIRFQADELEELFAITDEQVAEAIEQDFEGVQSFYDTHQDVYQTERELRIRRIFVRLPREEDEDTMGTAQAIVRHGFVRSIVEVDPDSFSDAAQRYSDASDAERGGDMGLRPPDDYEAYPFVRDRLDDLELNVIETHYAEGRYLIVFRLEEDNPSTITPLEEVQEEVARLMLEERLGVPIMTLAEELLLRAQEGMTFEEIVLQHAQEVAAAAPTEDQPVDGDPEDGDPEDGDPEDGDPEEGDPEDGEPEEIEPILEVQQTPLFALDRPAPELPPEFAQYRQPDPQPTDIPQMGNQPELARDMTQLTLEDPIAPGVYGDGETCFIARLSDFQPASEEIEEEEVAEIREAIRFEKAVLVFGPWQQRLILHWPTELGPFLRDYLDEAIDAGRVGFAVEYFQAPEPIPEELPAEGP